MLPRSWVILPHSPCELGKFSWAILGWLKKIIILGNYYPIEQSNNLTNILGNYFYLTIGRIFTNT